MFKWSAEQYGKFEIERLQPTLDLVNRIPDRRNQNQLHILDIGCGSGMSTYPLKCRFEKADIVGVDYSEEMLKEATKKVPDARFVRRDCNQPLTDIGTFDIIFSNAFLQWLPWDDQEVFIHNTHELLNKDGVFAIQIPDFDHMPVRKSINEVAARFSSELKDVEKSNCHNHTLEEYYQMFRKDYQNVTVWKTIYMHIMSDHEQIVEFLKGSATRPYLQRLNSDEGVIFIEELLQKVQDIYPREKNGDILFPFERIFITAYK